MSRVRPPGPLVGLRRVHSAAGGSSDDSLARASSTGAGDFQRGNSLKGRYAPPRCDGHPTPPVGVGVSPK